MAGSFIPSRPPQRLAITTQNPPFFFSTSSCFPRESFPYLKLRLVIHLCIFFYFLCPTDVSPFHPCSPTT